jgi:hypothetical protein
MGPGGVPHVDDAGQKIYGQRQFLLFILVSRRMAGLGTMQHDSPNNTHWITNVGKKGMLKILTTTEE